jgi:hypothetical protein
MRAPTSQPRRYENRSPFPALCSVNQLWLTAPASNSSDLDENSLRIANAAAAATPTASTHVANDICMPRSYSPRHLVRTCITTAPQLSNLVHPAHSG